MVERVLARLMILQRHQNKGMWPMPESCADATQVDAPLMLQIPARRKGLVRTKPTARLGDSNALGFDALAKI